MIYNGLDGQTGTEKGEERDDNGRPGLLGKADGPEVGQGCQLVTAEEEIEEVMESIPEPAVWGWTG